MTAILSQHDLVRGRLKFLRSLKEKLFIYPTDTIYGLGCNAEDAELVESLRLVKEQFVRPLSVIAPNMSWIRKNCVITSLAQPWLKRLPGPYTLILKLRHRAVAPNVDLGSNKIGVRLPDHWFTNWVGDIGIPIVTTSVNRPASAFMTDLDSLPKEIERGVDFVVYDGELMGCPSKIVDLTFHLNRRMVYLRKA
ncbi:MAG TPA: Sua5/YciO/YrdC/YwlC family protein [Candidatus Nanoarchaeia archaeon]|nr:Sua5/YciO/YrdC/YwlC family protein [Candidatus Nanoarchaeia archaeon]